MGDNTWLTAGIPVHPSGGEVRTLQASQVFPHFFMELVEKIIFSKLLAQSWKHILDINASSIINDSLN